MTRVCRPQTQSTSPAGRGLAPDHVPATHPGAQLSVTPPESRYFPAPIRFTPQVEIAKRHLNGLWACFAVLLAALALPGAATAQPGALDSTFGDAGRSAAEIGESAPNWSGTGPGPTLRPSPYGDEVHLATAPDSSFVVARGNLLLRFLPDGQLDPNFGEAGKLAISSVEGLPFGLSDIAFDSEGRILVFGTTVDPSISRFSYGYSIGEVSPSFVTVLRLDPTGEFDPSFGNGNGVFRDGLGLSPTRNVPADIPLVETASAELDSQGRAVIAVGKVGFPPSVRSTPGWVVDALVRLTPSGALDSSFGGGDGIVEGILRGPRGGRLFGGFCISASDEPIVASSEFTFPEGKAEEEEHAPGWLLRLRASGTPDRSFGQHGIAYAHGGVGALACTPSGRLFTLQGPDFFPHNDRSSWRVVRRSANGRVDTAFGRRVVVELHGRYSALTSLAVDGRGRILIAGTLRLEKRNGKGTRSFFTVFRLLPSGRLDRRFGHGGWVRTGFGQSADVNVSATAIDVSGRLIVAGGARAPWLQPSGIVMARYLLGR